jgi:hypothetical protein
VKVAPLRRVSADRPDHRGRTETSAPEENPRRDLLCLEPPALVRHPGRPRPQAAFLAHLLAVAQHAPQTQEKRRAEPQDAARRYLAAGRPAPARPGRALKRAV